MEVSIIKSLTKEFNEQQNNYGLLFGYTAESENHLISYLAPQTFQLFANEQLLDETKNDILNLAEDLHNSVNGYSLIGFIAKESEKITQQALVMKAQEYYVALHKRLKIKGSFYLCYSTPSSVEILEKKQGQVFTKVSYKEIEENQLVKVKALVPLNLESVYGEKDAQNKTLLEKITEESQNFLTALPNNNTILINNLLVTNDQKNIQELTNLNSVTIQFIDSSSTPVQQQFYARPYYFNFNGTIIIDFKVHQTLPIANVKTIITSAVRKELEARMYQVFGDQFAKKTISDTEEIQLPAKHQSSNFKNLTLSFYISNPSIQDYGSCIYSSLDEARALLNKEFNGVNIEFKAVDQLKVEIKGNQQTTSPSVPKVGESKPISNEQQQLNLQQEMQRKQQLSIFIFSLIIAVLAFIYSKI